MPSRICLALDCPTTAQAYRLTRALGKRCYAVKIHSLFDAEGGRRIVGTLLNAGAKRVWVDAKLHDTPKAAAKRAAAIACYGAHIISVHASGDVPMMKAVVDRLNTTFGSGAVSVWAITLLTSLESRGIARIYGRGRTPQEIVTELALMAKEAGLKCVVCSPWEVKLLSKHPNLQGLELVTPAVRSEKVNAGDHKRFSTPKKAIDSGANLIVVGEEVTEAEDPVAAFNAIEKEIADIS